MILALTLRAQCPLLGKGGEDFWDKGKNGGVQKYLKENQLKHSVLQGKGLKYSRITQNSSSET